MKFSRYLMRNFLKMFLIVVVGAIFMFVVIDFVGNIKTWLARDVQAAYDYYFSYLPYILYLITPVALFIAVLASVGNMTRHLEMSAMQSSGRNPFLTLMPIFLFGVLISVASYEMSERWLPDANHKRLEIMETNAQKKKNPRIKEKQNFTFIDSERASWFFRYYSGESKTGRDVVLLLRDQGRLAERYDARNVTWVDEDSVSHYCPMPARQRRTRHGQNAGRFRIAGPEDIPEWQPDCLLFHPHCFRVLGGCGRKPF